MVVVDKKPKPQGLEKAKLHLHITRTDVKLSSKAVQGPALPLEGIHHVHGSHSLPLGMLSVGDSITDDILQEHLYAQDMQDKTLKRENHLQDTSGLFIDQTTDPLDSSSSGQPSDGRLGDALNSSGLVDK